VPEDNAYSGARIVFHKPPPAIRAITPGTPVDAHTMPATVLRRVGDASLVDFGSVGSLRRLAACDTYHWTGWWPTAKEAVDALRKLRELNAPRIRAWKRIEARRKLKAGLDAVVPGAVDAINMLNSRKEGEK
jgi:hypothetical protein